MNSESPPPDDSPKPPGEPGTYSQEIQHAQISARVPEKVSKGVFSTGAMVFQGQHEFVIDFVLRMAQPNMIAARVILPLSITGSVLVLDTTASDTLGSASHSKTEVTHASCGIYSRVRGTIRDVFVGDMEGCGVLLYGNHGSTRFGLPVTGASFGPLSVLGAGERLSSRRPMIPRPSPDNSRMST